MLPCALSSRIKDALGTLPEILPSLCNLFCDTKTSPDKQPQNRKLFSLQYFDGIRSDKVTGQFVIYFVTEYRRWIVTHLPRVRIALSRNIQEKYELPMSEPEKHLTARDTK